MFLTHALRAIYRAAVVTGDSLWKYVSLLISGTPPAVTFISDASTSGNVLTLNGDTRPSNFNPYTPGYYSNYFDGTGDYLATPAGLTTAMGNGFAGNIITIEGWIYPTSFPSSNSYSNGLIGAYAAVSANGRWWFGIRGSAGTTGNLAFVWTTSTSTENILLSTSNSIVLNAWSHVAITINATTSSSTAINMFINGVLVNTFTGNDLSSQTAYYTSPSIGGNYSVYVNNYVGYISNFRVVKGTAVYTAAFTPPTAPLTAVTNTALLTCQSNRLIDNSVNNFAITKNGDTTVSGFTAFTPTVSYNGSAYFDGTGDSLVVTGTGSCVNFGTSNFTIEGWCYITSLASSFSFFDTCPAGNASPTNRIFIFIGSTGIIYYATSTGGTYLITSSAGAVSANQWTHIALVKSSSQTKLYVNGVQVGSTYADTLNYPVQLNRPILCANGYDGVSYNSTGYISDLRVVNGTAVYTANFTPPTTQLTAVSGTTLLTCQTDQPAANKQFVDNSGSNLLITQAGNTTQGTFSPYGANWSTLFASSNYVSYAMSQAFTTTTNFCVEAWLYPLTTTANEYYWFESIQPGLFFDSSLLSNNTVFIRIGSSTGSTLTTTGTVTINTWNHVAITYDGTTLRAFINGVAAGSVAFTMFSATNTQCIIGYNNYAPAPRYFDGYISNWRMSVGTARYTAAFTPSTTPFTPDAYTVLLALQTRNFLDTSYKANVPTVTGTPKVQRFSPFSPVIQTPTTYSTYFDGSGDYLAGPTSNTSLLVGAGDFTVEAWIYKTADAFGTICSYGGSAGNLRFFAESTATNSAATTFWIGSTSLATGVTINRNTWYHVAVTRSGTTLRIFTNGVQSASVTNSSDFNAGTLNIGGEGTGNSWPGYISNFRIVKGTAVYTAAFTPPTAPLTAITNTSLLTCQSATHIDNSSNAFTLTQNGDAVPRQFNPFGFTQTTTGTAYTPALYGGSAYFDGTGDYLATPATGQFVATGDFTIQLSFYLTSLAATNHLIGNYTAAAATDWLVEVISTGVMQVFLDGSTQRLGHSGLTANQWYHLSITRSGTTVTGRINGVPFNTTATYTMSGTFGTATKAIYMGMRGGSTNPLFGYITDVSLVNGTALYKGSFVPPLAPVTATAGTTLLLNMDKGAAIDSSRSNDLETVGDAKIVKKSPYTGNYSSMYFDGTGDYVIAPLSTKNAFGTGNFTAEMWLYPTAFANYKSLWGCSSGAASSTGFHTGLNASGNVFIYSATAFKVTTTNAMNLNAWNHVAFVRNGTALNIYINGVLGGTWTLTTQTFTDGYCWFGAAPGYASEYYTGYLADWRITNSQARYTAAFTPPTAPLPTS